MKTQAQIHASRGYTLIEMALVIAVLGVLSGMTLTMLTGTQEAVTLKAQKNQMKAVDEALVYHVKLRGRLPCPADATLAESDVNFARENCTLAVVAGATANEDLYIGMLPTRTLNISDRYLYDKWGNRLTYAVIKKLTTDATSFSNYATTQTTGVITIRDAAGNQMTPGIAAGVVAYAIISPGKDKKGARNQVGAMPTACGTTALDSENCNNDRIFIDADLNDSDVAANYYYDFIRWKDLAQLKEPVSISAPTSSIQFALSTVGYHSCGIKDDSTLWCWGRNGEGQIGNGTTTSPYIPTAVSGGGIWKSIFAGVYHTCGIKSDDTIWCWGDNAYGQLGDNTTTDRTVPTAVNGGGTWKQIAGGNYHTCGIKSNDTIWCWGYNNAGQLGDNTLVNKSIPTAVNGGGTWKEVSAGISFTCGVKSDGTGWCWGDNTYGQLGDGTVLTARWIPTAVIGGHTWQDIDNGMWHTCGVKSDGTGWCWGYNNTGQLGDGTTSNQLSPFPISGGGSWTKITGGANHSCGIKGDGSITCWGSNTNGRLGDGTTTQRLIPNPISGGGSWQSLDAGYDHNCALKSDNTIQCWGYNGYGEVGDNTNIDKLVPTSLSGGGTWGN